MEKVIKKGNGAATNRNGLGVEFGSKYSKVQLSEI